MAVLVAGGAGYIGSHMCLLLAEAGTEVIVLDNLSTGMREFVRDYTFYEGALDDAALLTKIFKSHQIEAVMHFAAHIEAAESMREPSKYYRNNVSATQVLLDVMLAHNVTRFIFSSTAAIFGMPQYTPIDEQHPRRPINPYGRSKLMVEQMLDDYDHAYGLKSICLRYFNAAGADPKGRLGECHTPETHLIPLALQVASGRRDAISVFGSDYQTKDGTCIRDYIHVNDLAAAHLLAMNTLKASHQSMKFNLGNGSGFSVKEVVEVASRVTAKEIPVRQADRRAGDPDVLIADAALAKTVLAWQPGRAKLVDIINDAWKWECSRFC